jgi:hypothetical protein
MGVDLLSDDFSMVIARACGPLHWLRLTSVRSTGRAVASGADLPERRL